MTIGKKYNAEESAALRVKLIEAHIVPYFRRITLKYPMLKSMTMMVAQYYSDEAADAVHYMLFVSELDRPNLEAFDRANAMHYEQSQKYFKWEDPPGSSNRKKYRFVDPVNWPSLSPEESDMLLSDSGYSADWPDCGDAVPAFAAFCKEDGEQYGDPFETHTIYAFFRMGEDREITIDIVGEMIRPWLDGIRPLWESR